ncbi:hypothetical protein CIB48_g7415 [Xylaria polymorpha]|nr:hypothetical protein CIB48_g7415 [Xylaria polymorpha]
MLEAARRRQVLQWPRPIVLRWVVEAAARQGRAGQGRRKGSCGEGWVECGIEDMLGLGGFGILDGGQHNATDAQAMSTDDESSVQDN